MKILFVSLGCDKNSVDSEVMLGALNANGHTFTDDENEAQAAIVNTCCFIGDAKEESINTLIELGQRRLNGQFKALIATGCLAQRYAEDIHKNLPEVDCLVGISAIDNIAIALENVLNGNPKDYFKDQFDDEHANKSRVITTGGYYDYLKIAEGCNKRCTYCVIPSVRGNYRSLPMDELVLEANELAKRGIKELILVAQETTVYGIDLYGKKMLPELLRKLCQIEDIKIIRLLYCYPEEITDELIDVISKEPKIAHYLDMPIQSGSDDILKSMGRCTNYEELKALVTKLRNKIPDICLRTTLITGFPGETKNDHEASLKLVNELKFDRLGAFTYSREENTIASKMKNQVSERVKKSRYKEIMAAQQEITFAKNAELVGRRLSAIIEGYLPGDQVYVGRTYRDAPDVDGYLFINSSRELLSGDIVDVLITDAVEYDLIGDMIDEFTE